MSKTRHKVLFRAGMFVRKRAQWMLRRRKKPSEPGRPPSVHSRDPVATLKNIWAVWDSRMDGVLIGPRKLNQVNYSVAGVRVPVPRIHEFGATIAIREWKFEALDERSADIVEQYPSSYKWAREWTRRDLRWQMTSRKRKWTLAKFGLRQRVRNATYPARPFMQPALRDASPKIADLFRNSLVSSDTVRMAS